MSGGGGNHPAHASPRYNDLEQTVYRLRDKFPDPGIGESQVDIREDSFDVTVDGLDRGEIAEIVQINLTASLGLEQSINLTDQDGPGSLQFLGQFSTRSSPTAIESEIVRGDANEVRLDFEDELGVLAEWNAYQTAVYIEPDNDTPNGAGAPGSSNIRISRNFRDITPVGPLVDRFDDLFYHRVLQAYSTTTTHSHEARLQILYDVHERDEDYGLRIGEA